MNTVYDMSTGRILETPGATDDARRPDFGIAAMTPQLQLQPVVNESLPKRGLPPELVLADPNAFLDKMS